MAEPSASPARTPVTAPVPPQAAAEAGAAGPPPARPEAIIAVRPVAGHPSAVTVPDGTAPVVVLGCLALFVCGLVAWLLVQHADHRAASGPTVRPRRAARGDGPVDGGTPAASH